jgi:hypothetical protein
MPKCILHNSFIRPSCDKPQQLSIAEFVKIVESHKGLFVVDGVEYDNILYCGTDNLYFSFCFNFKTGRAVIENLLIVDNIEEYPSSSKFVILSQSKEYSVYLKE